jgi:outer membrane protein TolC
MVRIVMTRIAWLLCPLVSSLGLSAQELLTLDRAVELAVKNNRQVKAAALEVQKSEDQVAATRTNRLPQFQFNAFGSQLFTRLDFMFPRGAFGTFPGIGPVPAANTDIPTGRRPNLFLFGSASQPLSQLHKISLGIHLQQLTRDLNREKLEQSRQTVANNVKKIYYGLVQAQSALDATEESIKLYTEIDRVVGESLSQQVVLKSESLDVKTSFAKSQYTAVTLRNNMATLREQLNDAMGRDLRLEFRVESAADSVAYNVDLEPARARAVEQRPEMRQARIRVRQAEYDRSLKKSEYIPDVSLNFTYLSPFTISVLPKNFASAGLMLNWDVFDWGRRRRELGMKDKTIEQAKLELQETEAQILLEVDTRARKLDEQRALLKVTQLGMETAREKVRVAADRYAEKSTLLKDVLQTQTMLADAAYQYQQALAGFWTARADFEKAVGDR